MAARFLMSATDVRTLADTGFPEVAFVGRSNVGKSSLLGALLKQPKLVRVSRTPGRTQLMNLFDDGRNAYVDLPGYGYAKVPKSVKVQMNRMILQYVTERHVLRGVVQILDARRESVTDDDRAMAEMVLNAGRLLLVAVSKIDLIPKTRRFGQLRAIERDLGVPAESSVACSAKTGEGIKELRKRLEELSQ